MLAVVLKHTDPALTLPLFLTSQADEALAEWRAWGELLDMPLLLAEQNKVSRAANARWEKSTSSALVPADAVGAD